MNNTHQTKHGIVTVSIPYFSCDLELNAVELTLDRNGWSYSREIPAGMTITPSLVELFAQEAVQLL